MQRIDVYIEDIAVFINDTHCFLQFAIDFNFLQAAIRTNAMINMRNKIAGL